MPFSVECGACGAHFKLSQEIYERRIVGRKVSLRCKKCKAEIPVDGTKFGDPPAAAPDTDTAAPAPEPAAPAAPDPNFSFMPQVPAAASIAEAPPVTAPSSASEILPRDTSWFPAGGSEPAPRIVVETPPLPALPTQPESPPQPESEPPGREPMETPRVPIAVGREAMPTPRNLEAQLAAATAASEPTASFDARSVAAVLAASAMSELPSETMPAAVPATPRAPEVAPAPTATPRVAEARPSAPRAAAAPRPKVDAKPPQVSAKRELPSRPQQVPAKPELPSRPTAAKPELPSRPKNEPVKRELPSRPREQPTRRDLPSRPKFEPPPAETKPEPSLAETKPEPPLRPRQESRPQLDVPPPAPRPKQESKPRIDTPPFSKPEFRPRLESAADLSPLAPERARTLAAEAVAKALASTEPEPGPASLVALEPVQALPAARPISLPPLRPSLPPGRRAATIAMLAAGLVVVLVVLGWMLSTVSSRSSVPPVPSGLASVTAPGRPSAAPEPEEEEEDEPAVQVRGAPPEPSPPSSGTAPAGSSPGLLEQLVQNLNSQADDKSFDRAGAMKALDAAANRAARCRSKGDPSGSVTVLVIFNPAGTVKEAKVVGSSYDGSATARCIASRMATARIRAFQGPPKTLAKSVDIP